MTTRSGWQRAGSGGLLLILLVCLCFSRGEGIRLLPFSEHVAVVERTSAEPAAGAAANRNERVQSGLDRKVSSHLAKSIAKHLEAVGGVSFSEPKLSPLYSRIATQSSSGWHMPSKFSLTSSSDRSPPFPNFIQTS